MVEIAQKVDTLLRLPAQGSVSERIQEAAVEWQRGTDLDPDVSPPLPVPDREVSLAERYTVLAAVWDAVWKGAAKIDLWPEMRWPDEREGIPYKLLVCTVHDDHNNSEQPIYQHKPSARTTAKDRGMVWTWLADVESDLTSGNPAAADAPTGKPAATAAAPVPKRSTRQRWSGGCT